MERLTPEIGTHDKVKIDQKIRSRELVEKDITNFIHFLSKNESQRFYRIVRIWTKKLNISAHRNTIEMTLVRQIVMNTLRIEEVEYRVRSDKEPKYQDADKYSLLCQRERREMIKLLLSICKATKVNKAVTSFDDIRNKLREEKGIEKTETELEPDQYDRDRRPDVDIVLRVAPKPEVKSEIALDA